MFWDNLILIQPGSTLAQSNVATIVAISLMLGTVQFVLRWVALIALRSYRTVSLVVVLEAQGFVRRGHERLLPRPPFQQLTYSQGNMQ